MSLTRAPKYSSSRTGNLRCRSHVKMFKLNISSLCEPIDYRTVECSGYCSSRTMLWKNVYEVSNVACCSIVKMYQEQARLYCLAPVELSVLVSEVFKSWTNEKLTSSQTLSHHQGHTYDIFRENFISPNWTANYVLIGERLYTGYYSIPMTRNATCRCQSLDD